MIAIEFKGLDALTAEFAEKADELRAAASKVVQETAAGVEAGVKLRMQQGPHTGRIYRRRGVVHRASGPGQPPAPDTGALMDNTYHEMVSELTSAAGSRLPYAYYLEYGTFKMAARPAWTPEMMETEPEFKKEMELELGRVLK